jgi:hypothetical protein
MKRYPDPTRCPNCGHLAATTVCILCKHDKIVQPSLPLDGGPTDPLREIYESSPALKKQFPTFEQAISDPLRRKGIANAAREMVKARGRALALLGPIPLPPISEDGFIIAILLAALGGGVIGCILTLIRRGRGPR